jgi:hypothetical protein
MNESWTATVNTFGSLSNARWGNNPQLYDEAAWLTLALLDPANAAYAGDIQFAVWAVFGPGALNGLSGNDDKIAQWWLTQAENQTWTAGEFSNFLIYTAVPNSGSCGDGPCPTSTPQEFLVKTPEPTAAVLLAVGLLALAFATRRQKQIA